MIIFIILGLIWAIFAGYLTYRLIKRDGWFND